MIYSEFRPLPELSDFVVCTWERRIPRGGAPPTRVLPDGCVDLLWRNGRLSVAGPDRGPFLSGPPHSSGVTIGLRLRPGIAGNVLGLPASEIRDERVPLEDLWGRLGRELAEKVGDAEKPQARRAVLEQALLDRLGEMEKPDPQVLAASRALGLAGSRVGSLSRTLGLSERQLLRRFTAAVGYGPKTLDRVLRFQRFLARAGAVARGREDLARLAADLGYADQAHLTRECVRLSGLTPARLAASRAA